MFARYYVELPIAFDAVEGMLLEAPVEWVPGLLRAAEDRGQHLLADVGFEIDTRRVDKEVEISLGESVRIDGKASVPMTWHATAADRLFPQLDGDLEIAALGSERTQLSMNAQYRPPMGAVGRAVDRALLHRVAEATIKDFVDRVGERIAAALAPAS
jgi:hypothetical protein